MPTPNVRGGGTTDDEQNETNPHRTRGRRTRGGQADEETEQQNTQPTSPHRTRGGSAEEAADLDQQPTEQKRMDDTFKEVSQSSDRSVDETRAKEQQPADPHRTRGQQGAPRDLPTSSVTRDRGDPTRNDDRSRPPGRSGAGTGRRSVGEFRTDPLMPAGAGRGEQNPGFEAVERAPMNDPVNPADFRDVEGEDIATVEENDGFSDITVLPGPKEAARERQRAHAQGKGLYSSEGVEKGVEATVPGETAADDFTGELGNLAGRITPSSVFLGGVEAVEFGAETVANRPTLKETATGEGKAAREQSMAQAEHNIDVASRELEAVEGEIEGESTVEAAGSVTGYAGLIAAPLIGPRVARGTGRRVRTERGKVSEFLDDERAQGQLTGRDRSSRSKGSGDDDLGPDLDPFDVSDKRVYDPAREFPGEQRSVTSNVDPTRRSGEATRDIGGGISGRTRKGSGLFDDDFTWEPSTPTLDPDMSGVDGSVLGPSTAAKGSGAGLVSGPRERMKAAQRTSLATQKPDRMLEQATRSDVAQDHRQDLLSVTRKDEAIDIETKNIDDQLNKQFTGIDTDLGTGTPTDTATKTTTRPRQRAARPTTKPKTRAEAVPKPRRSPDPYPDPDPFPAPTSGRPLLPGLDSLESDKKKKRRRGDDLDITEGAWTNPIVGPGELDESLDLALGGIDDDIGGELL